MLVRLTPDPDQIRWHCRAALNSFKTLDLDDAAEASQGDLRGLLKYLDDAEQTLAVPSVGWIKTGANGETGFANMQVADLPDFEPVPPARL